MTTGVASFTAPERGSAPASRARVLRARLAEFMLVGGATLLLFPLSWLLRGAVGLDSSELAVGFFFFHAAFLVNDPHFAVTYLLFYEDARRRAFGAALARGQRARYVFAGLVVPVALVAWAAVALGSGSPQTLGWMIHLMFLLVGWHYVKQGFGVMAVLSARRGAPISARERTVLLVHCFAGWAFAWANPATEAGQFEEKGIVYWAPARPRWLELTTGSILALSTLALVVVLVAKWRRERRMLPIAPLAGLLITVWAWTVLSSADPLMRYAIPALHSIQYLYFVWLMKRNEARAHEGPPSFGRPVTVRLGFLAVSSIGLALLLFHGLPGFLDGMTAPRASRGSAPDPLGATPFLAAIFVIVNLHHYFMDHVIWRRENPDTRYLRST